MSEEDQMKQRLFEEMEKECKRNSCCVECTFYDGTDKPTCCKLSNLHPDLEYFYFDY